MAQWLDRPMTRLTLGAPIIGVWQERDSSDEEPFPQDFRVILGRARLVAGVGDYGDDCSASRAARHREPGATDFGGSGKCVSDRWTTRRPRISGRILAHATRASLCFRSCGQRT